MPTDNQIGAFVISLAQSSVPVDIQELLLNGNSTMNIAPGALQKALTAAEQAQEAQPVVKVKQLEWGPYHNAAFTGPDIAVAPFSVFNKHFYQAQRNPRGPGFIAFVSHQDRESLWESNGYDCIDAAKAAAQADFEQRILSCLIDKDHLND